MVCNYSGVFRDLFINQMNLLDRAIKAGIIATVVYIVILVIIAIVVVMVIMVVM